VSDRVHGHALKTVVSLEARIADLNGIIDMMRENAVDREQRIAALEALVVRVEQQRNTMTAERDELESLLDEVWYSSLIPEPLDVWKAALRTRLPMTERGTK